MKPETDLGCISNLEVINRFVTLAGRHVVDAGCGDMTISKLLQTQGARVLAIDPDPVQAQLNRDADPIEGLTFVETGADQLPVEDHSIDGVFFSYSLHHIPATIYPDVFQEMRRVLKPNGFLYVIEPTDCPLNQVMMLFHDEQVVRAQAQQALQELAAPHFKNIQIVTYHSLRKFESFDDFAGHYISRSFNTAYTETDVRDPAVQAAFEKLGAASDYEFEAPKQVMVLQGLK